MNENKKTGIVIKKPKKINTELIFEVKKDEQRK